MTGSPQERAILAAQEGNQAELARILSDMLPHELRILRQGAKKLAITIGATLLTGEHAHPARRSAARLDPTREDLL